MIDAIEQYKKRLRRFKKPIIIYALGTPIDTSKEIPPVEILLDNDFAYCGYCKCSGTTNYKYSKDNYIVYWLPKRKQFHLKLVNNYIIKNKPIHNLCRELKSANLLSSKPSLPAGA